MVWLWQTCDGAARMLLKEYLIHELLFSHGLLTEKSHEQYELYAFAACSWVSFYFSAV